MYTLFILILTLFSLIAKVCLIVVSRTKFKFGVFSALLATCTLVSLVEVFIISSHFFGLDLQAYLRVWYLLVVWCFCFALIFAVQVTNSSKILSYVATSAALIISPLLYTDFIISGYIVDGKFMTAIKESYYPVFSIFAMLAMAGSIAVLVRGLVQSSSGNLLQSLRASYVLLAYISPFAVAFSVILLQLFGFKIHAITLFPIASTFMFVLLVRHQNEHLLFDIKAYLPWSAENKLSRAVVETTQRRFRGETTLKESMDEIEKAQLVYTLTLTKGNKYQAAKNIGTSKATFYSKLNKHGLGTKV